jgi:NADPH:quinone reductase-like Zn-dependent oxidoreductase
LKKSPNIRQIQSRETRGQPKARRRAKFASRCSSTRRQGNNRIANRARREESPKTARTTRSKVAKFGAISTDYFTPGGWLAARRGLEFRPGLVFNWRMKAFQLMAHGAPGVFALRDVPEPKPGTGEVAVRVAACGLNRLDLWTEEGALPVPINLPRTPGCELAGEVAVCGEGVDEWRPGDRVAAQSNIFCGKCEFCLRGEESICLRGQLLGAQMDGGFAEFALVPAAALLRLPPEIDFNAAAGLGLAASTAMHMLTRRATVKRGDWVLVIGAASGVGSAAIQIAAGLGARVITTGSTFEKREFGLKLGAAHAVDSGATDWAAQVRHLTGKRGVDLVIEHVGGPILEQVFNCLVRGGSVVTCGATAGRNVSINLWPFFVKQQRLIGSYGRDRVDLAATLRWAAEGRIKPAVTEVYPLADAAKAFAALRSRLVMGKVVICP